MKYYGLIPFRRIRLACILLSLAFHFTNAGAQSPTVTAPSVDIPHTLSYQGTLADKSGKPLDSVSIPMVVSLYSDDQGTNRIWQGTYTPAITKGVFGLQLGSGNYPLPKGDALGHALWLGIAVGGSAELRPLTPVAASAYALNVADNSITAPKMGTDYVSSVQINGQQVTSRGGAANFLPGQGISMSYDSTGQGILINTQKIAQPISNSTGYADWGETGNSSLPTYPSTPLSFIGITDNTNTNAAGKTQLEVHLDDAQLNPGYDGNIRVMLYEEGLESPDLIGGYRGNVTTGIAQGGAVIGGGGYASNVNTVAGDFAFVGGGYNNTANLESFVGGGTGNSAVGQWDVVTGGQGNTVTSGSAVSAWVTISGGLNNTSLLGTAPGYACYATIAGGSGNQVAGQASTVGGGGGNKIGPLNENGNEQYATIAGGSGNLILNSNSASGYSVNYATIGGGTTNEITTGSLFSGESSTISGGKQNGIQGAYSAIPGGQYLTLGDYSFGFNGDNQTGMLLSSTNITQSQVAYFGNVDLWLGNVDGTARQLRFYEPNSTHNYSGTNYTSFQAPGLSANVEYILPTTAAPASVYTALLNDGTGQLLWGDASLLKGSWKILGNNDIIDGTDFLGTTTNVALTFRANNLPALRIEPNSASPYVPNIIGGYSPTGSTGNVVVSAHGSVISGGGQLTKENTIYGDFDYVGAGDANVVGTSLGNHKYSSVVGGEYNPAQGQYDVVVGGYSNYIRNIVSGTLTSDPDYSFIGGGNGNSIDRDPAGTANAAIVGGSRNHVLEDGGFIGAGDTNIVYEDRGAIVAGSYNFAGALQDFIGAGTGNKILPGGSNAQNAIVSGESNSINGTDNFIGGGNTNKVNTPLPITGAAYINNGMVGGTGNNIWGNSNVIVGGESNQITTYAAGHVSNDNAILGGNGNRILGNAGPGTGGDPISDVASNYSVICGGKSNTTAEEAAFIGSGENNHAYEDYAIVVGGNSNEVDDANSSIIGGGSNTIDVGLGSFAFIGGGQGNKILSDGSSTGRGFWANIPGGQNLTAQSYAQTVIGYNNQIKGESTAPINDLSVPLFNNPDDPILIVGNGATPATADRRNAFEISNDGHSLVFDTLGAVYSASSPYTQSVANTGTLYAVGSSREAPIFGGTYVDNPVYAWADVPAGTMTGPVIPNNSFGVQAITYDATHNFYTIKIELNDQNGNPITLNKGSVTATIEGGTFSADGNGDPGCATIAVSGITGNQFNVWTHFADLSSSTCRPTAYGFSFKVCGRP